MIICVGLWGRRRQFSLWLTIKHWGWVVTWSWTILGLHAEDQKLAPITPLSLPWLLIPVVKIIESHVVTREAGPGLFLHYSVNNTIQSLNRIWDSKHFRLEQINRWDLIRKILFDVWSEYCDKNFIYSRSRYLIIVPICYGIFLTQTPQFKPWP